MSQTIGSIINDKYRIDSLIGSGGMANVYKAENLRTHETVAIKFLKDDKKDNAEYVRRFEREAQAGMALNHQNIVRLLDAGKDGDRPYIVFEYINGPTLKSYMESRKPFTARVAVNIAGSILDALGYAHGKGVIHRDVKPQNVMIMANGTVKLADFGIARLLTKVGTKSFTGTALGSVHYISPEQAKGGDVTHQTDLYSVGIILYEMLTGQLPYDNESDVAVAVMHINDKMVPPQEKNHDISHALNAVIMKATAKNINLRYKSAAEMKTDLQRALREPDGTFADLPEEPEDEGMGEGEETIAPQKTILGLNKGVFILTVSLLALLIVMAGAFMIIRSSYNPKVTVPALIDMTVEEAQETLGSDLGIEVKRESSDKNPGYIIAQDPASGKKLAKGSTVTVTVSIGSENAVSPDLTGRTLSDANRILQERGLSVGAVIYEENSEYEAGTIFDHTPKADDEVKLGTEYKLYISGIPQSLGITPKVTEMSVKDAVDALNEAGFTHVIVRTESSGAKDKDVTAQDLNAGLEIDTETPFFLTMCSSALGKASHEGAYNITLERESYVIITVDTEKGYEIVVYEGIKPSGTTTVSFTAHAEKAGKYDCNIYIDNALYKNTSVTFSE